MTVKFAEEVAQMSPGDKLMHFLACVSAMSKTASEQISALNQKQASDNDVVQALADVLVAEGVIHARSREKAANVLTDHGATLGLLSSLLQTHNITKKASEVAPMGTLQKTANEPQPRSGRFSAAATSALFPSMG